MNFSKIPKIKQIEDITRNIEKTLEKMESMNTTSVCHLFEKRDQKMAELNRLFEEEKQRFLGLNQRDDEIINGEIENPIENLHDDIEI